MTKQTEALRKAMRWITDVSTDSEVEVLNAIDEALAETQEPVAYIMKNDVGMLITITKEKLDNLTTGWTYIRDVWKNATPLYTTPPSREWVGLSDRELFNLSQQCDLNHILGLIDYGRAIEAKLREINNA